MPNEDDLPAEVKVWRRQTDEIVNVVMMYLHAHPFFDGIEVEEIRRDLNMIVRDILVGSYNAK